LHEVFGGGIDQAQALPVGQTAGGIGHAFGQGALTLDDALGQGLEFLAQPQRRPFVRRHQRGGEGLAHVVGESEQPRYPVQEAVERVETGGALLGFDALMRFANDEAAAGRLAHAGHRPASAPFLVMAQFAGATDITDLVAGGSPRR
jgi:hypothetical protein